MHEFYKTRLELISNQQMRTHGDVDVLDLMNLSALKTVSDLTSVTGPDPALARSLIEAYAKCD